MEHFRDEFDGRGFIRVIFAEFQCEIECTAFPRRVIRPRITIRNDIVEDIESFRTQI